MPILDRVPESITASLPNEGLRRRLHHAMRLLTQGDVESLELVLGEALDYTRARALAERMIDEVESNAATETSEAEALDENEVEQQARAGVNGVGETFAGSAALVESDTDATTRSVLAAQRAEPRDAWLLIPFGRVEVERPLAGRDFTFTRQLADSVKRWFDKLGRPLAIDYEHQSIAAAAQRSDGLRPAAGWIGGLEVRPDGLWAVDVRWTDRARSLLQQREYLYFSPVIYWSNEAQTEIAALGPVALTNDPAMRGVTPLAASRVGCDSSSAPPEDEAPGDSTADGRNDADPTVTQLARAEAARAAAERQVSALQQQLAAQAADAFVERGLDAGKIVDATSLDWRDDYLRDAEQAESRLSRAPVLAPPGRLVTPERGGAKSVVQRVAAGDVDTEDIAAFERAAREGRVVVGRG